MTKNVPYYDIIIIGSGMSGLYSAYQIQKMNPNKSFLILEKFHKQWIGGRTSNEIFYGTKVVTGAGIGRKDTNPLLIHLMNELHIKYKEFHSIMDYSSLIKPVDVEKIINNLKNFYKKYPEYQGLTFKQFFIKMLGSKLYKQFTISAGYTDYENADLYETLYNYGMDDNKGGWTGLYVPWKKIVDTLYKKIGSKHFKFNENVVHIEKVSKNPCLFEVITETGSTFHCNKVIVATTIDGIKKLVPDVHGIYKQIHGQPFLRLYGKFDKKSALIMEQYAPHYTIVPGPLQKIIPMNSEKGVYMIAYSDNANAVALKDHLKNTPENRDLYCELIEQSLGIPNASLKLVAIKDFYWPIGTHYYEPLNKLYFKTRDQFLKKAQHPEKGMLVVGEAVSRYQGWVEGALESVQAVLTEKWIENECYTNK
jgi:hypothetical protein